MADLDDIITRNYSNFRGVDFTGGVLLPSRSPDALNMWRDYKDDDAVQTRPGMTLLNTFEGKVLGLFFYKDTNDVIHTLVHINTQLLKWNNYPNTPANLTVLYTGLSPQKSKGFVYDNVFFLLDGINYIEYNGTTVQSVAGTIPLTSYMKNPDGSTSIDESTDTDLVYQPVNCLTPLRKNAFIADGTSTVYKLDAQGLDPASTYLLQGEITNGTITTTITENIDFTVDRTKGWVTFTNAPVNEAEVVITYSKTNSTYRSRILNCTLMCTFDNRLFFSGNKDYPNTVFWSMLNDPRYVPDINYETCGLNYAQVRAIIPGNNVLWVIKDMEQEASSVYYLTPTLDTNYGKIYPSVNGSIALGCVSCGVNFQDDIVFFSNRGLEGISSSSMYSEQILQHRSSLVDAKMLQESDYLNVKLAEYDGYLLCLMGSHIYLADSRQKFQNTSNDVEYDWYYWELPFNIDFIKEYRGTLFLGNQSGQLFTLSGNKDNGQSINSYWTTRKDDFGAPSYTKTTNKRGNVIQFKNMGNTSVNLSTITDGETKDKTTLDDSNSRCPFRNKDKKFKEIQIKLSSTSRFGIYQITIQGFVAGFIKR